MMRFVVFCHSLRSDWNHGNAHFLRGLATELRARGHQVQAFEPRHGWSFDHLVADAGPAPVEGFLRAYPGLVPTLYDEETIDLDAALAGADVVLVHEWSPPDLVRRIGAHRAARGGFLLFFHDTHHRAVTAPDKMARYDLRDYDAVLAFGDVVRRLYLERGWARRAYTWHEAADTRVFRPAPRVIAAGDLVFIGNWGDEERTAELEEFVQGPVRALGLRARIYGVRYPMAARRALAASGVEYGGYLPNFAVPRVFARYRVTVHVPRRPYARALPGVPTIRPFEALACGIPLVSAPWDDAEGLFTAGADYVVARDGAEMKRELARVLADPQVGTELAAHGLATIRARHTCGHRVDELLALVAALQAEAPASTVGMAS